MLTGSVIRVNCKLSYGIINSDSAIEVKAKLYHIMQSYIASGKVLYSNYHLWYLLNIINIWYLLSSHL